MKTIEEVFLDVFNSENQFEPWNAEIEDIQDIVETGMDYDYFKLIVRKYAEQVIDRCAETAVTFIPSHPHLHGARLIDSESILMVKKELK
jgi:hypothetical protein